MSRRSFHTLVALTGIVGLLLILYQHLVFGVPFLPGEQKIVWSVDAKIEFQPDDLEQTQVRLALPAVQAEYAQLHQDTTSTGYSVDFVKENHGNFVQWSGNGSSGKQVHHYRTDFVRDPQATRSSITVPTLSEPADPEPYASAMQSIASQVTEQSTDPFSITARIIQEFHEKTDTVSMLLDKYERNQLVVRILSRCGIPARVIGVLSLEDNRHRQHLKQYIAVFRGAAYRIFDSKTGGAILSDHALIWNGNGEPLLDIVGGKNAHVSFSTHKNITSAIGVETGRFSEAVQNLAPSVSFAIGGLPTEEQRLFRSFLLLPIGVVIVVFLRIIVGIKTIGTFMPALIAMSFLQTTLPVGLVAFLVIVGFGLDIRSWLSHLHLLQISRISAVIIVVIALVILLTIFAYQVGLAEQLRLTFFPLVILSWTIERMSVLWEEEGVKEVLRQGGGSLFVAICGYFAMDCAVVEHLTFNFFGLQLVLLSFVMLMGRYTGYRFSELQRFAPLSKQIRTKCNGDQTEPEVIRLKAELSRLKADPGKTSQRWKAQCGDQQEQQK